MNTNIRPIRRLAGDDRQPLRAALEAKAKAARAVEFRLAAIDRARGILVEAEVALEAARAGVEAARERHADRIAEAAAGGTAPATPGTVRQARAAERDCEDDVDAARGALERLASGLPELEEQHALAASAVIAAANAVVAPIAASAVSAVRQARAKYFDAAAVLMVLLAAGDEDKDEDVAELSLVRSLTAREQRAEPLKNVKAEASDLLLNGPVLLDAERPAAFATQEAWRRWRQDLRTNPDAVPPEST